MTKKSDEFSNFMLSPESLSSALEDNPNLITEQDEKGRTLLHHAASIGLYRSIFNANKILKILFKSPGLDFTIQDNNGDTPLHVAAFYCKDRVTCEYVFPAFVEKAVEHKFDFSILGQGGQSVLHIATRTSYMDPFKGRINNVNNVLKYAPKPGLNVLSSSGSTAFFYALNHCHFKEAHALLDAGANPTLFGDKDRDPLAMLEEHLKTFTEFLSHDEYADRHENITAIIEQLNDLKQRILLADNEQSYVEVRKNARVLTEGVRAHSLFAHLPSDDQTQEGAEKIVKDHLNRPGM